MTTKELIIAIAAAIGAVLGIFNFIRSYLLDSERVRVKMWTGSEDGHPRVEVVNHSAFPITVIALGRVTSDGAVGDAELEYVRGQSLLPKRIEARDACSFPVSPRGTIAQNVYGGPTIPGQVSYGANFAYPHR